MSRGSVEGIAVKYENKSDRPNMGVKGVVPYSMLRDQLLNHSDWKGFNVPLELREVNARLLDEVYGRVKGLFINGGAITAGGLLHIFDDTVTFEELENLIQFGSDPDLFLSQLQRDGTIIGKGTNLSREFGLDYEALGLAEGVEGQILAPGVSQRLRPGFTRGGGFTPYVETNTGSKNSLGIVIKGLHGFMQTTFARSGIHNYVGGTSLPDSVIWDMMPAIERQRAMGKR